MSLRSWKREFYPVPAERVAKDRSVAHSLKKWIGLLPRNIRRHNLRLKLGLDNTVPKLIGKDGSMNIGGDTCSLCEHYQEFGDKLCVECPLAQARGGHRCDKCIPRERHSPYGEFSVSKDPLPMIGWLCITERMKNL